MMKMRNLKYWAVRYDPRTGDMKMRSFATEKAKDAWCNRQYDPNNEEIVISVYNKDLKLIEEWGA